MAEEDWSEAKAWMRATRERIGMTQHDVAVLANLTVDMVKKYESEKYRIQPSPNTGAPSRPSWNGTGGRKGPCSRSPASPVCPRDCPTGSGPRNL